MEPWRVVATGVLVVACVTLLRQIACRPPLVALDESDMRAWIESKRHPEPPRYVVTWRTKGSHEWITTPANSKSLADWIATDLDRQGFAVLGVRLATPDEVKPAAPEAATQRPGCE